MLLELLIAGHLLSVEINEVWKSDWYQSSLLLGTWWDQSFLFRLVEPKVEKLSANKENCYGEPLISVLRSSSGNKSEDISDGVGEETSGPAGLNMLGRMSVNPSDRVDRHGEEGGHQAAQLNSHNKCLTRFTTSKILRGNRSSWLYCGILTVTDATVHSVASSTQRPAGHSGHSGRHQSLADNNSLAGSVNTNYWEAQSSFTIVVYCPEFLIVSYHKVHLFINV